MATTNVSKIIDSPEKELALLTGRRVRLNEDPPGEGGPETDEKPSRTLNFPEVPAENMDNFHMARGHRVCGLLVDPGAASCLIGTNTLKEFMDAGAIPPDRQDELTWGPS